MSRIQNFERLEIGTKKVFGNYRSKTQRLGSVDEKDPNDIVFEGTEANNTLSFKVRLANGKFQTYELRSMTLEGSQRKGIGHGV